MNETTSDSLNAAPIWSGPMLAVAFRACADEAVSRSDRRALHGLASAIEGGERIETLLDGTRRCPEYLHEILNAGIRSDRFPEILQEYLRTSRQQQAAWGNLLRSLSYPVIMLGLSLLVMGGFVSIVMPPLKALFNDFGVELPEITRFVIMLTDGIVTLGWAFPLLVLLAPPTVWWLHRQLPGRGERTRWLMWLPIFGSARRHAGGAEFCSRLAVLVDANVPLHRALEIMSRTLRDHHLRSVCRTLSRLLQGGLPPEDVPFAGVRGLLPSVAGAFRWAREPRMFSEGLKSLSESLATQSQVGSDHLAVWVEPLTVGAVGTLMGTIVIAMFMPLIKLLNELA